MASMGIMGLQDTRMRCQYLKSTPMRCQQLISQVTKAKFRPTTDASPTKLPRYIVELSSAARVLLRAELYPLGSILPAVASITLPCPARCCSTPSTMIMMPGRVGLPSSSSI